GLPLRDDVIYELQVGTFTEAGTFDAVVDRLDYLADLGVSALELMPVAQFPGERNWGYDGVLPFAVQNSYGGPAAMKRLVDAAHRRGMAVVLDVVYNHLGPEGNYLGEFAPYFTQKYRTPWGPAVNVDDEYSDGVRDYFIQNALEWVTDYHIDGLRLDAVHGILDTSAKPFLAELSEAVHGRAAELGREVTLIAESDLNDVRMIRPTAQGGMGMDAQWMDDFHHALHALLTREDTGYYADYGGLQDFATALRRGYVFTGDYSEFRKRRHGNSPDGARAEQFVVCIQNHDQVGNRMMGDRLAGITDFERQKLAAACVLASPYIPLLFMGEEYGERRPFPYFIQHSDENLVAAVRLGRKQEFAAFSWSAEPPDPAAHATFETAIIEPLAEVDQQQRALFALYRELIALRKQHQLGPGAREAREVCELRAQHTIVVRRQAAVAVFCFAETAQPVTLPLPSGSWYKGLCTASTQWRGPGDGIPDRLVASDSMELVVPPTSAVLFLSSDKE
ncbi:MAG TPA: malto-oligosyltrehalose trehalohydrolase, partial [Longimicrobiales bacterium]